MRTSISLLLLCLLPITSALAQEQFTPAEISINALRIPVEVANTPSLRQYGLMHRRQLPSQQGMLFINPDSDTRCMWMKNTLIPLSVAFIDAQGHILNIEDMQPNTRDYHCSVAPAQYALEMNLGWFRSKGIRAGDKVMGLERLQARE